jgi:hypothetical protein
MMNKVTRTELDMPAQHSRLYPWYVGVAVIAVFELVVASLFFGPACQAPAIPQILILVVLPLVYLTLMFMALRSQP